MIMTSPLQELLFSFHGVAVRYVTSSPALVGPGGAIEGPAHVHDACCGVGVSESWDPHFRP